MVPNPVELLNSRRFSQLLKELRQRYDYIVVDLPSAGSFSDAFVVSEQTDGLLLVVRRGVCRYRKLRNLSQQLQYLNRKAVGVVYNCAILQSYGSNAKRYFHRSRRGYRGNYISKK